MKSPIQRIPRPFWLVFLAAVFVPLIGTCSFVVAAEPVSDAELNTMGQGFGKFVGSFMRQVQSAPTQPEGMRQLAGSDGRRSSESGSSYDDRPTRREPTDDRSMRREQSGERSARHEPDGDRPSRQNTQGVRSYPLYDPWGADRWGDPYLGYDPWSSSSSWVDYDWNARKRQYGWSYGGVNNGHGLDGVPRYGGGRSLREHPWNVPFGLGGYEGGRYDYEPRPPPLADPYPRSGRRGGWSPPDDVYGPYDPRDPYAHRP